MSISTNLAVWASAFAFMTNAFAHGSVKEKNLTRENQIIQIKALNNYPSVMKFLNQEGFDVMGVDLKNKTIDVDATVDELEELRKENIKYTIKEINKSIMRLDDRYLTPEEIDAFLIATHEKYPSITSIETVGQTLEGKTIKAIKITANAQEANNRASILFNGMHHAREIMTTEVTTDIIRYLTENYGRDEKVSTWVNTTNIYIIPIVNIDGNKKVWSSDNMWRKNTRGGFGVDINRNYPTNWGACNGSSGWKSSQTYRGESAGSEPETQAMMSYVSKIKPVFNISYHSYSELVIYPMGCQGQRTSNREIVEGIGQEMGRILDYTAGTSWETLYSVDGSDIDWMYAEEQVIPYVIEVSPSSDGFQPAYAKRDETVLRNRAGWQLLLDKMQTNLHQGIAAPNQVMKVFGVNDKGEPVSFEHQADRNGNYRIILDKGQYTIE